MCELGASAAASRRRPPPPLTRGPIRQQPLVTQTRGATLKGGPPLENVAVFTGVLISTRPRLAVAFPAAKEKVASRPAARSTPKLNKGALFSRRAKNAVAREAAVSPQPRILFSPHAVTFEFIARRFLEFAVLFPKPNGS